MIALLAAVVLSPVVCAPPVPPWKPGDPPCRDRGDLGALVALYEWPSPRPSVGWKPE